MAEVFNNMARSTLASAITNADLSLTLATGDLLAGTTVVGGLPGHGPGHKCCAIIEVDGTQNPPRMVVSRYEYSWIGTAYESSVDTRFVVGAATGPNSAWYCTFRKYFAPFQPAGGNAGFDSVSEIWSPAEVSLSGSLL